MTLVSRSFAISTDELTRMRATSALSSSSVMVSGSFGSGSGSGSGEGQGVRLMMPSDLRAARAVT